jgi:hypothetical protein
VLKIPLATRGAHSPSAFPQAGSRFRILGGEQMVFEHVCARFSIADVI